MTDQSSHVAADTLREYIFHQLLYKSALSLRYTLYMHALVLIYHISRDSRIDRQRYFYLANVHKVPSLCTVAL